MKDTHQIRVAGVGTAIGAVIFGALIASCAPGKLPCDKDEQWRMVCDAEDVGQGGSGGGGGGQGGASGMGGGPSGMGGAPSGEVTAATEIDCAAYPTVGKMDDFFAMRCGVNATCHQNPVPWSDFKSADVFKRMLDIAPKASCTGGGKLIDKANWANSVVLLKTKTPVMCPPGATTPGTIMPPPNLPPMMDPLSPAELTCLENFVKKVAGAM